MAKGKRETAPLWITEVCQTEVAIARTREELEEDIKGIMKSGSELVR